MIVVVTIIVNPSLYDRRIPTHYNIMIILAHSLPWYICLTHHTNTIEGESFAA
jgi:hypothetical protein